MPKPMNNVDFVKHMMEFSPAGPLAQVFILEGIHKYAETIAALSDEEVDEAFKESWVYGRTWRNIICS